MRKFFAPPLNVAAIIAAVLGAGMFASCSNELNEPGLEVGSAKLLRAPEVHAWSGSHSFGNGTRAGEVIGEYYTQMPDFTDWCNSWWPQGVSQSSPAIPADAVDASQDQYSGFQKGGSYVLSGTLNGFGDGLNAHEGIHLTDIPDNVTLYVKDGAWALFDDFKGKNLKIVVCEDAEIVLKDYEGGRDIVYENIDLYNYGSAYIYYNNSGAIGSACNIYNTGKMVFEQNYVDDNSDLSLDPLTISQPIYSGGSESEVYFKGGVNIKTDKAYFRKVCVDGQMTVEGNVHAGYLNTDELYGRDNSTVTLAPEGMIVAGTISMKKTSRVNGVEGKNGFITTNEIIGENKTQNGAAGNKMESEVNAGNFADIFSNVDIYVTKTINNYQDLDVIRGYKAKNGTTYPLNADTEFDSSENDDVRNGDVLGWDCGIGYTHVRKPKTEDPKTPDIDTPDDLDPGFNVDPEDPTEDPNTPGVVTPTLRHDNEVEINLALNDSHSAYSDEDLMSKLSIHVRYPGDVEVFIPVPQGYYCEADDFNLRENELYIPGANQVLNYEIAGKTVTLTISMEKDGIRVTTDGIDQDVIDFCMENYGDGVNFEVFNYYGLYEEDGEGNWVRAENGNIARETILGYLNRATVKFLDSPGPDYYINAFKENRENEGDHDCTVRIIDGQDQAYGNDYYGEHLNNSDFNHIYIHKGVNPDHAHTAK